MNCLIIFPTFTDYLVSCVHINPFWYICIFHVNGRQCWVNNIFIECTHHNLDSDDITMIHWITDSCVYYNSSCKIFLEVDCDFDDVKNHDALWIIIKPFQHTFLAHISVWLRIGLSIINASWLPKLLTMVWYKNFQHSHQSNPYFPM